MKRLKKEKSANEEYAEIGEAFMDAIAQHNPDVCWNECPAEVYIDALNSVFDRDETIKQLTADKQLLRDKIDLACIDLNLSLHAGGIDRKVKMVIDFLKQALAATAKDEPQKKGECGDCMWAQDDECVSYDCDDETNSGFTPAQGGKDEIK